MKDCTTMEESAKESKHLLNKLEKNYLKSIEETEATSTFINKDRLALNKRSFKKTNTEGKLYHKLSVRQERLLKDMDEYFDVVEKFTKEESQAFLRNREESRSVYESQVARFAKDHHRKEVASRKSKKSNPYLVHAEKFISKNVL